MSTPVEEITTALAAPFDPAVVRFKPAVVSGNRALALAYVDARVIQDTLDRAQIPPAKQARARSAILRERLSSKRIRGIWLLRLPPGADA